MTRTHPLVGDQDAVAIESVVGRVAIRNSDGTVVGPVAVARDGGLPAWEIAAALVPTDEPHVVVVAGTLIKPGSAAHFGWLRAVQPVRLFSCRRSVHLLWRHPSVDGSVDERLTAYSEIAAAVLAGDTLDDRLHQIALREVVELDTDLDRLLQPVAAR